MAFLLILLLLAAGYGLLFYASRQEQHRQHYQHQQESDRNRQRPQQQQTEQTRQETLRLEQARTEQSRQQFREAEAKRLDSDRQLAEALAELEQQKQRLRQLQDRVSAQESDQPAETPTPQLQRQQAIAADRAAQQIQEIQRQQAIDSHRQRIRQIQQDEEHKRQKELEPDRQRIYQDQTQSKRKSTAHPIDQPDSLAPDRINVNKLNVNKLNVNKLKQSLKVTRQIKSKLEKLCGSDYRLAQRLVDEIRADHPDRTEQWCWEKAVWDMERDRRR